MDNDTFFRNLVSHPKPVEPALSTETKTGSLSGEPVEDKTSTSGFASMPPNQQSHTGESNNAPIPDILSQEDVDDAYRKSRRNAPSLPQAERFDEPGYAGGYKPVKKTSVEQTQQALRVRETPEWQLLHGEDRGFYDPPEDTTAKNNNRNPFWLGELIMKWFN